LSEKMKRPVILRLRDTHHMMARLFAAGLRPGQVAARMGYSLSRVSVLQGAPQFQDLVAAYREEVDGRYREAVTDLLSEYTEITVRNGVMAARLTHDTLEEAEPGDIALKDLTAISAHTADRYGFGKQRTNVNVNVGIADALDRCVERSGIRRQREPKLVEAAPAPVSLPRSRFERRI